MKKTLKKLTLHRETLCSLNDLHYVAGAATALTVCATNCATNCRTCDNYTVTCDRQCLILG